MRTPSQTVGPYYAIGLCRRTESELARSDEPGAFRLVGSLLDGEGTPVPDGMVEVWDPSSRRWGRSGTAPDGSFSFVLTKPGSPPDGGAPRLDVLVFARGLLRHQLTRVYFPDDAGAHGADPVLASLPAADRPRLLAEAEDDGMRFDIRLQGDRTTPFFA